MKYKVQKNNYNVNTLKKECINITFQCNKIKIQCIYIRLQSRH